MSYQPHIVLAGQQAWSERLSAGLSRHAGIDVEVAGLDSYARFASLRTWMRVWKAETLVRVGFRPAAPSIGGRLADTLMSLGRARRSQTIIYWIGSDVRDAMRDARDHAARLTHSASSATHIAGSQPLADDLKTIGIDAEVIPFPLEIAEPPGALPSFPQEFTVVSYVPDARPEFYGGPQLMQAAVSLPEISFLIMGGSGGWSESTPPNVSFLGWVTDTQALYARCTCVARLVEYDSIGGTVIEGLLAGRPVVYSRRHPDTIHVEFGDIGGLTETLAALLDRHVAGDLEPDIDAARRTWEAWNPAVRFARLADVIRRVPGDADRVDAR